MLRAVGFGLRILEVCLPAAADRLDGWRRRAQAIEDPERRRQALASIGHKAFHSLGAAVFAAWAPSGLRPVLVDFAVALQTLSDYLDNLCDRSWPSRPSAMARLHAAMVAAVGTAGPGGERVAGLASQARQDPYVRQLVVACQDCLRELRDYPSVESLNRRLARLYGQMQARKHAPAGGRRRLLVRWFLRHAARVPQLSWWEYAAACGSTLPIFALTAASAAAPGVAPRAILGAYAPWVGALHILLDYLIDLEEDRRARELNFAACYGRPERARARIRWLYDRCRALVPSLPDGSFHRLVVAGLPALYLTDPKGEPHRELARQLAAEDPCLAGLWPLVSAWRRLTPPAPAQVEPAWRRLPEEARHPAANCRPFSR